MKKLVWLLALLCLAPAYYSCSTAQTPPVQSSNVAAPPTTLGNEPTLIDSSQNKNSAIETIEVYPPDPITGGQINVVHNKDQSYALVFKDAKTQKVLQTLTNKDLETLDIFLNLPHDNANEAFKLVDLKALSPERKKALTADMHIDQYNINPNKEIGYMHVGLEAEQIIISPQKVAFAYGMVCYDTDGAMLGTKGNIAVFDATGKQECIINDPEHGTTNVAFTNNGKYLMKQYGYLWGEGEAMEIGYKIYELPSGKLLMHYPTNLNPQECDCGKPIPDNNQFVVHCVGDPDNKIVSKLIIFNPNANAYYLRNSVHEEFGYATPSGFLTTDGRTLLYEKDFEKYSFNQTNTQKTP
jgi:hypothetical protein